MISFKSLKNVLRGLGLPAKKALWYGIRDHLLNGLLINNQGLIHQPSVNLHSWIITQLINQLSTYVAELLPSSWLLFCVLCALLKPTYILWYSLTQRFPICFIWLSTWKTLFVRHFGINRYWGHKKEATWGKRQLAQGSGLDKHALRHIQTHWHISKRCPNLQVSLIRKWDLVSIYWLSCYFCFPNAYKQLVV